MALLLSFLECKVMDVSRFVRPAVALLAVLAIAGCGRHSQSDALPATSAVLSPGLTPAAPMVKTQILPASVMLNARVKPDVALQAASYTQLPGSGSFAAASPDGSLWVLSDEPAGPDKYIWHYSAGTWTNITGLASRIAVSHDGATVYAINSIGAIYAYNGGTWTSPGSGASDITVDATGAIYVLSNGAGVGANEPVWVYNGSWALLDGTGVRIVASDDRGNYGILNGGTGNSGGIYILNAAGSIYHEFPDGPPNYQQLPGLASELTATIEGGIFVLGYPASESGTNIYYLDLDSGNYNTVAGSGVGISTNSQNLYVISSNGGIYSSPIVAAQDRTFGGPSTTGAFASGTTMAELTLPAYQSISLSVQFGPTLAGSGTITLSDALNNGDITPTLPADDAVPGSTPEIYLSIYNAGPSAYSTGPTTPTITVTKSTGFGSATACEFDFYGDNGNGGSPTWNSSGISGVISGNTATLAPITLPDGNTIDIKPGQTAAAISCQ